MTPLTLTMILELEYRIMDPLTKKLSLFKKKIHRYYFCISNSPSYVIIHHSIPSEIWIYIRRRWWICFTMIQISQSYKPTHECMIFLKKIDITNLSISMPFFGILHSWSTWDDLPHRWMVYVEINKDGFESLCLELTIGISKTIPLCMYKHSKLTR